MGLSDLVARLFGRRKPQPADPTPGSPRPAPPAPAVQPTQVRQAQRLTPVPAPRQGGDSPGGATPAPDPGSSAAAPVSGHAPRPALEPMSSGPASQPGAGSTEAAPASTAARLPPAAESAAPTTLKPGHRRELVRDERLSVAAGQEGRSRRSRAPRLPGDEARRLFAPTLRTGNRALRALATDAAQLARYGLPAWRDEVELAAALEIDLPTLRHLSIHSARERAPHYVTFAVPKRSGGERLIMAPKARLKSVQRRLDALLVRKLPVSEFAHGFRRGHSVRTNAQPHVGRRVVLHLDLKDFFPSIHFGRVRGLLIALGYGYQVAAVLATLMTEAPRQPVVVDGVPLFPPVGPRACPQGAPTSPGLSNAIVVRMDRRLAGLARRFGFEYSRYADDLTFSGNDIDAAHALRNLVAHVVYSEGFVLNAAKTRVMRSGSRQAVTGVTVNDVLGLSRRERRNLRAALHQLQQRGQAPDARLHGHLAWLHMLNPAQAARLREQAAAPGSGPAAGSSASAPGSAPPPADSSPSPLAGEGLGEG